MSNDFIEKASETLEPLNSPHLIICFDNADTDTFRYIMDYHDDFGRDKAKIMNAINYVIEREELEADK